MVNNSNKEVESKIIEVSSKPLESRLAELGAKKIFEWELAATWFMNVNKKEVRVRKEWETIQVEYKELLPSESWVKECIEIWYQSDNLENTLLVFKNLWFKVTSTSVKKRVSYLLRDKTRLDFDTYSKLGPLNDIPELLEIEASSRKVIIKIANLLGYNESDLKDWTPKELIQYYTKTPQD